MTLTPEQITKYSEIMARFEGDTYWQVWKKKEFGGYKPYSAQRFLTKDDCLKDIDDHFIDGDIDGTPYKMSQYKHEYEAKMITKPYHTDYNWLMRVWVKFRDLDLTKFERELYYMHSKLRKDLDFIITRKSKEEAFVNLGEAIEWYQQLKSNP